MKITFSTEADLDAGTSLIWGGRLTGAPFDLDLTRPTAILIGSEGSGLDPSLTQSVLMGPGPTQERAKPVEAIVPPSSGSESVGGAYSASNGQMIQMPRSPRPASPNGDPSDRRGREKRVVLSRNEEH